MTTPRNPDDVIAAFLAEGQAELPNRAFEVVRRDIHRTRQRVVIGPWRAPNMSNLARVAIAATAVVAVGLAWFNFSPSSTGIGGLPTQSPPTTVSPSPTPEPISGNGLLEPGRHVFDSEIPMSITVPANWYAYESIAIGKNIGTTRELALAVWPMVNTYVDPCLDHTLVSPAPGPGVDDIANALASQPGVEAGPPADVTIDGYSGKLVELTVTADITTCIGGKDGFWLWADDSGGYRYVQGTNEWDRLYILDVDGERFTFAAAVQQASSAADRAELDAIIESIDIAP
jgi:hypothetical protein